MTEIGKIQWRVVYFDLGDYRMDCTYPTYTIQASLNGHHAQLVITNYVLYQNLSSKTYALFVACVVQKILITKAGCRTNDDGK